MINVTYGPVRWVAAGAWMLSAALMLPGAAAAADAAKPPTFTRDVAPIFQEKCEACHRPDSMAPMSLQTFAEARPWARSIKARVTDRQMPPWQIDGMSAFRNSRTTDRSPTSKSTSSLDGWTPERHRATQGHASPQAMARRSGLEFRGGVRPERAGPDHQAVRLHHAGRVAGRLGQARHAIGHQRAPMGARDRNPARDGQGPQNHASRDRVSRAERAWRHDGAWSAHAVHGVGGRQAGRDDAPNTGKLLLPGSKFHWDIHYSQVGKEISSKVEMGIYFYPKGQEPNTRHAVTRPGGARHPGHPAEYGLGRGGLHDASRGRTSRTSRRTCTCAARR